MPNSLVLDNKQWYRDFDQIYTVNFLIYLLFNIPIFYTKRRINVTHEVFSMSLFLTKNLNSEIKSIV